jgi:hypothetical protein
MPSPELGAGPGLIELLAAALTAPAQSIAIVNTATIVIMLITFFISITTYNTRAKTKYRCVNKGWCNS